jgi:hypothetical protein
VGALVVLAVVITAFEEVGRAVDGEANALVFEELPDMESIVATAAKYGIEIPPIPQHGRA